MLKSKLKVLLAQHDSNQRKLAETTGLREATINAMANNKIKQIPVEAIEKICALFDCDIGDIFEYIPESHKEKS